MTIGYLVYKIQSCSISVAKNYQSAFIQFFSIVYQLVFEKKSGMDLFLDTEVNVTCLYVLKTLSDGYGKSQMFIL